MERVMNDGRVWKLSLIFAAGWILAGLAIAFDTAPADGKEFSFPSTPAGKAAQEWFAAMATGEKDILRTFFARRSDASDEPYDPNDDVAMCMRVLGDTGSLTPRSIMRSEQYEIVLLAVGTRGKWVRATLGVDSRKPYKMTALTLRKSMGPEAEAVAARQVEPAAQKDIALEAARLLRDRYVYEKIGKKYADRLATIADSPAKSMTAEALATSLTSMLQSIQRDKHLKILDPARARRILAMFGMLENEGDDDAELEPGAGHHAMIVEGDGFGRVERFAGNIAYIEITMFVSGPSAFARAEEVMASVQDAAAIVFDLRGNGGGDGEMVEKIEAYLFAKPTHIMSSIRRGGTGPTQGPAETWTKTNRLSETMSSIPVFILAGGTTGSAAEAFAFGLKHADRAIVIGQPTAGAGHRVSYERLPHGFALGLPVAAAISPKTGKGWEGVGVIPNVNTQADATLDVLISMVREQLRMRS